MLKVHQTYRQDYGPKTSQQDTRLKCLDNSVVHNVDIYKLQAFKGLVGHQKIGILSGFL